MTVDEIIVDYLKTNGFDGLCNVECGCPIDDLHPCGEINSDCVPAYKHERAKCEGCHGCGEDYRNDGDYVYCAHKNGGRK
jgi:hypothetical protein